MAKVIVACPFEKLQLPHQNGLQPTARAPRFLREGHAPLTTAASGRFHEWALRDFEPMEPSIELRSPGAREAAAGPGGVHKLLAFILWK
jgi:hypothetical protein